MTLHESQPIATRALRVTLSVGPEHFIRLNFTKKENEEPGLERIPVHRS